MSRQSSSNGRGNGQKSDGDWRKKLQKKQQRKNANLNRMLNGK